MSRRSRVQTPLGVLGSDAFRTYSWNHSDRSFMAKTCLVMHLRVSIVVSISACHADDPGSIPGRGTFLYVVLGIIGTLLE